MDRLAHHIEALVFASNSPISIQEIMDCLEATFETEFKEEEVKEAIESIRERYEDDQYAFELVSISGGLRFLTKSAYFGTVGTHLKLTTRKRLSKSALETLSILAYKQPVSKSEMENIRGVGCDYALQKLLEKELVTIVGRSEGPGRPLLYGTSEKFMDYFGLKSLDDLPKPKDFHIPDNSIGEQAPIEELAAAIEPGAPPAAQVNQNQNENQNQNQKVEQEQQGGSEVIVEADSENDSNESEMVEQTASGNENQNDNENQNEKVGQVENESIAGMDSENDSSGNEKVEQTVSENENEKVEQVEEDSIAESATESKEEGDEKES